MIKLNIKIDMLMKSHWQVKIIIQLIKNIILNIKQKENSTKIIQINY